MSDKEKIVQRKFHALSVSDTPKPNLLKHCIYAFIVGGLICDVGQFFTNLFTNFGYTKEEVSNIVPVIMVFLGALLTGLDIYDKIAEYGGAGTVVPITGLILTKLDGTAKGGVVIGIVNENSIPVKFVGVGEKIDDMEVFNSKDFVDAII